MNQNSIFKTPVKSRKTLKSLFAFGLLLGAGLAASAYQSPVVNENFNTYPLGAIEADLPWTSTMNVAVEEGDLVSTGIGTTGQNIHITNSGNVYKLPATYGAGTQITWMSVKVHDPIGVRTNNYIEFYDDLDDNGVLDDGTERTFTINNSGEGLKWRINTPPPVPIGTGSPTDAAITDVNKSFRLVFKIDPTDPLGNYIKGYVDPTAEPTGSTPANITGDGLLSAAFNFVRFNTYGGNYHVDDFRLGSSYEEVTSDVLPVNFVSFTGKASAAGNQLTWTVDNEVNNKVYEVLRKSESGAFVKIGEVAPKGNGNNAGRSVYSFTDREVASAYYQIRQVDNDGQSSSNDPIYVSNTFTAASSNFVYPNPVVDNVNVVIVAEQKGTVSLQFSDLSGKVVLSETASAVKGLNNLVVDMSAIPTGVYVLKAINSSGIVVLVQKVVKN